MTKNNSKTPIQSEIRGPLQKLRRRIRLYVLAEGVSVAVVWLCLTFWVGLAIDYLPVMVGASEMPHIARVILLAAIASVLALILFFWIVRRTFVRLPDQSMALLLERHFDRFEDSLVTAVEMACARETVGSLTGDMLTRTADSARSALGQVSVSRVFRLAPVATKLSVATIAVISIGLFYAMNAQAFTIWTNRLYLLKDQTWPRKTQITVEGIQIQRNSQSDESPQLSSLIPFPENREIKIAKGTNVVLKVSADAAKVIPEFCEIHYRTSEDERGQANMQKSGRIRADAQQFSFDGKPFRGMLSSIKFDVRALDHRVQGYRLTMVPSPAIIETELDCVFPQYMVNEELSSWMPRTLELASGTQLPIGTQISIRCRVNKDLTRVEIRPTDGSTPTTIEITDQTADRKSFLHVIPALQESLTFEVTLYDTDGVMNDPPHKMFIAGIQDLPPTINANLDGIGTAITPNAIIPAKGRIDDDYEIQRSWFEVFVNDGERLERDFTLKQGRDIDAAVDFRSMIGQPGGLTLKPKDKLTVTVMAADKYDLGEQPNIGTGDRFQLEVVTADELLAMLERRELGLRRRFEQVIDELGQMRDSLSRVRNSKDESQSTAPEDSRPSAVDPTEQKSSSDSGGPSQSEREREASLRLLRTQRAAMQSQKSEQEISGIAESFDDIRRELINNRIDSEDRKTRLRDQIINPLRSVCSESFPILDQHISHLEQVILDAGERDAAAEKAIQATEQILFELDKVLQKMVELETFNELVNIVRSLIDDQNQLIEDTKKERVKRARSLLE